MILRLFIFFALLCSSARVFAATIILNEKNQKNTIIQENGEILFADDQISDTDIINGKMASLFVHFSPELIKNNKNNSIWYWFKIRNNSNKDQQIVLTIDERNLDSIKFYFKQNDGDSIEDESGDRVAASKRLLSNIETAFSVKIHPGDADCFIKITNHQSFFATIRLWTYSEYFSVSNVLSWLKGNIIGFLILIMIYNFLLFLGSRKFIYALSALYIFSVIFAISSISGIIKWYLLPTVEPYIYTEMIYILFTALSVFVYGFFLRLFFQPVIKDDIEFIKFIKNVKVLAFVFLLVFLLPHSLEVVTSFLYMVVFCLFTSVYTYVFAKKHNYKPAYILSLAMILTCFFYMVYLGMTLIGSDLYAGILTIITLLGVLTQVFTLSFATHIHVATEQKVYEKTIESMNIELKNRIAKIIEQEKTRTEFFNHTSHELRTPLNGIIGFVGIILEDAYGTLSQSVRDKIKKIRQLADNLTDQVNTILDLAKSQTKELPMNYSSVHLNSFVTFTESLAISLRTSHQDTKFAIKTSWPEDLDPIFTTDAAKIKALLRNVVGNAFKFKSLTRKNLVDINFRYENSQLEVSVKDKGIGIHENYHEKIFHEFVQVESSARRSYEGTGLGLALVRKIMQRMNGTVTVYSQLGEGSEFILKIPGIESSLISMDNSNTPAVPLLDKIPGDASSMLSTNNGEFLEKDLIQDYLPKNRNYHILVVDDNLINLEVIATLLEQQGYHVLQAQGGREAIAVLGSIRPDLVLLDLMMPEVSGEDVLKHIRSENTLLDIPVIFLTARASSDDKILGLQMGANDYLAKPLDRAEVLLRVRNTLFMVDLSRLKGEQQQLIEAEKISSLGRMADGIAHEINNPLAIIKLCTDRIEMAANDPVFSAESITKKSQTIEMYVDRIQKIISMLKIFAKDVSIDQFVEINLSSLLELTKTFFAYKLSSHQIEFQFSIVNKNISLLGLENLISQVYLSVIENAIDAVNGLPEKWIKVEVTEDSHYVTIAITDSGKGIPSEIVSKIFDPFFTTKDIGRGIGLGLSIAKGIIEDHKGSLIYNDASLNTCFLIQLPIHRTNIERLAT